MSRPNAAADHLAEVRRRTSDGVVRLAYHAALPVVVDPGLLNLMRVNFFLDPPDALPFQDEAALLLSPLFREIGDDLYEIDPKVRNLLLIGLNTKYGPARVRQVALLLEHYTESTPSWNAQPELQQAQRLTALSFIDPDRARAWLRDAQAGAEPGTLSREWFVAMGQSLASQAHDVTVEDEVAAAIGRLSSERLEERLDAIRTLGALSRLPDTDPAPIVVALDDFLGPSARRSGSEDPTVPADVRSAVSLLWTLPALLRGGVESDTQPDRPKIFLCYRREDTQGFARGIYQSLAGKYGHEQIFRDIDSTPPGVRYSAWIESRVGQCSVMIVLIGEAWSSAKDRGGQRRLDSPKDWVRQEIETALRRDIPIIPVRVQGAPMPSEDELPPSIADLTGFQSAEVTDSRWDFDVGLLIQAIDNLIASV